MQCSWRCQDIYLSIAKLKYHVHKSTAGISLPASALVRWRLSGVILSRFSLLNFFPNVSFAVWDPFPRPAFTHHWCLLSWRHTEMSFNDISVRWGRNEAHIVLSSCCSPATGLPMIRRPQELQMIVCQMLEYMHLVIAAQLTIYKWLKVLLEWLFGFSAGYPCGSDEQEAVATDFVTVADCQLIAERPLVACWA